MGGGGGSILSVMLLFILIREIKENGIKVDSPFGFVSDTCLNCDAEIVYNII